jgi:hypothetical protein
MIEQPTPLANAERLARERTEHPRHTGDHEHRTDVDATLARQRPRSNQRRITRAGQARAMIATSANKTRYSVTVMADAAR